MRYCQDCHKLLKDRHLRTKRCIECAGLFRRKAKHICIDCKTEIDFYAIRCRKCYFLWIRKKAKTVVNPNKKCIDCGVSVSRTRNKRCVLCSQKRKIGENNSNFIHGQGNFPYPLEFSAKLKAEIRKRDNYTCQICNRRGTHVHHIDYDKQNCKKNNLITTCNFCNIRANFNRDYWYSYFVYLMEK